MATEAADFIVYQRSLWLPGLWFPIHDLYDVLTDAAVFLVLRL